MLRSIGVAVFAVALSAALYVPPGPALDAPLVVPVTEIEPEGTRAALGVYVRHATRRAETDAERIEAWTAFVQRHLLHPTRAPLMDNGQAVYDPATILRTRLAHCGQVSRTLADGLDLMGFKTRVVQLKNHIGTEVWHAGQWRYLDADWLEAGVFIRKPDGSIPSAAEIHRAPSLLDGVPIGTEFQTYPASALADESVVVYRGGLDAYKDAFSVPPRYIVKTATAEQESASPYYGWNYYQWAD
jgi:hypothetical protein